MGAEFAASLAADQERVAAETAAAAAAEQGEAELAKRKQLEQEEAERLAKNRKLLADEFVAEGVPAPGDSTARLALKLPTGERVERSFASQEKLGKIYKWVEACPLL